jgi:hypothetical protein
VAWFYEQFWDADVESWRAIMLTMYASGIVLASRGGRAETLQFEARRVVEAGPPPVDLADSGDVALWAD